MLCLRVFRTEAVFGTVPGFLPAQRLVSRRGVSVADGFLFSQYEAYRAAAFYPEIYDGLL